jgi:hypothetical protein
MPDFCVCRATGFLYIPKLLLRAIPAKEYGMAKLITEKKYQIEIKIDDVSNLFLLYTNPHKFFVDNEGTDSRAYKTNYEEIFNKIFSEDLEAESWHKKMYADEYYKCDAWNTFVFRGHENQKWELETTLYREYTKLGPKQQEEDLFKKEKELLREFQRQYNRFGVKGQIEKFDYYEWFSWMQHYGVPSRFLDFSYSFFVALYFASNNISFEEKENASFSIYAVNRAWLEKRYKSFLPVEIKNLYEDKDSFGKDLAIQDKVLNPEPRFKAVINMNPFNLNSRLVHQKGLFLFPTDLNSTFMENLNIMLVDDDGNPINTKVIKINVELSQIDVVYLYKQLEYMNIGAQTLFENKLESLGEILKRKLLASRYSDILSLNPQGKI